MDFDEIRRVDLHVKSLFIFEFHDIISMKAVFCSYLLHCTRISELKKKSGTCPGNLYSYFDIRENRCREGSTVRVGVNEAALARES